MNENFTPLKEAGVLKILCGNSELFEGIDIIVTNGHVLGQQHVLIKGEEKSLFFCADLFPAVANLPIAWHTSYDNYPMTIIKEKEKILSQALENNWVLFFEHDPDIPAATVKQGKNYVEVDSTLFF